LETWVEWADAVAWVAVVLVVADEAVDSEAAALAVVGVVLVAAVRREGGNDEHATHTQALGDSRKARAANFHA